MTTTATTRTYSVWLGGDRVYNCVAANVTEAGRIARGFVVGAVQATAANSHALADQTYSHWLVTVTTAFDGPEDQLFVRRLTPDFEEVRFDVLVEIATGRDVTTDDAHRARAEDLGEADLSATGEG